MTAGSTPESPPAGWAGAMGTAMGMFTPGAADANANASLTDDSNSPNVEGRTTIEFKPNKPKFGGFTQVSKDSWAVWTGGKPKADWSELEEPSPQTVIATQYRTTSIAAQAKSRENRIKGLENKFSRGSDLQAFEKKLMKRLTAHGLDTITYMPSPTDPTKVVSVIFNHALFNMKDGVVIGNDQKKDANKFDSYCHENDLDAKEVLLASVDEELETQLYEDTEDEDSFISMYFHLIHVVRSVSINRFDKIKDKIKARKISDYSGENIELIATDYLSDWKELHGAGLYDQNLTMNMVTEIMMAGGQVNEDFRHPLRDMKMKLNKKLLEIRHLSYSDAHTAMAADELDVQSILKLAKAEYREMYDNAKWPAATSIKDNKAVNKNFGRVNKAETTELRRIVNALVQSSVGKGKGDGACHNCGALDHWARDCPKPKKPRTGNGNGKPFNSRFKSQRNNPGRGGPVRNGSNRNGPGRGGSSQRTPPPKAGESEIKVINGKKSYWCQKCSRWTLSHGTDNHKSKEELQAAGNHRAGAARVDFNFHPSAFSIRGPSMEDIRKESNSTISTSLRQFAVMGLIGSWIWFLVTQTDLMEQLSTIKFIMTSVGMQVFQSIHEHWMQIALGVGSGGIGFGTATVMYHSVQDTPTSEPRIRNSVNACKQVRRKQKKESYKMRAKHFKKKRDVYVPPKMIRENLTHRPKFNNIGRDCRNELPTIERIRQLEKELAKARKYVRRLEEMLKAEKERIKSLRYELRQAKKERDGDRVRQQEKALHKAVEMKWCGYCKKHQKSHGTKNCKTQDVGKRGPMQMDFTLPTPCVSSFKPICPPICGMANLVNLLSIAGNRRSDPNAEPVLFDSGANCCITSFKDDFSGDYKKYTGKHFIEGIGKGLSIAGSGTVAWTFKADNGMYRTLRLPCLYVPNSIGRIASLYRVTEAYPTEGITMKSDSLVLSGDNKNPSLTVPFCPDSHLPMAHMAVNIQKENKLTEILVKKSRRKTVEHLPTKKHPSLTMASNLNLSGPEKELLRWHEKLGHISMKRVQSLFRLGVLSTNETSRRLQERAAQLTGGPLCPACQYAKQRRKTTPGATKKTIKSETNALKKDNLFPGQLISVDHFACNPHGRLLTTYGKEPPDKKYEGGCIFVDHATSLVHVENQSRINATQTLEATNSFEKLCTHHGVVAQSYLSDNGPAFTSKNYAAHLSQLAQTNRFSSVGAHHSNGIAERNIQSVMSLARAMMHHAAIHWPDVMQVDLWPLAVLHAAHIMNRIPRDDCGRSPIELFSRKTYPTSKFLDFHVWGCPVYVLDETVHSGGAKLPRWKPRCHRGMYVGNSEKHGHNVPLVLNLETGAITAQYHVVYDDWFTTVEATIAAQINFEHDDWYRTFGLTEWQYVQDDEDHGEVPQTPGTHATEAEGARRLEDVRHVRDQVIPATPLSVPAPLQRESDPTPSPLPTPEKVPSQPVPILEEPQESAREPTPPPSLQREKEQEHTHQREQAPQREQLLEREHEVTAQTATDRADPLPQEPKRLVPARSERPQTRSSAAPRRSARLNPKAHLADAHAFYFEHQAPQINKAKVNSDPDTYTWEEGMASPYREQFLIAVQEEIDALTTKGTWHEDLKSNATTRIVPSQWVLRIKRTVDGDIKKFKARICVRGDLQEDKGESNFSPVAAWPTVRAFLIISIVRNWVTTSIDFSNAFVQSELPADEPVWMHVPRGYKSTQGPDYCLKLDKSLYGLKQAPLLWFNHSGEAFKKLGLKQSAHDPCLWYGKDIMLVQYCDDCGISAPTQAGIDQFVSDLRKLNFELTQEGTFAEFLGIKFEKQDDGSIVCTQKGLIKKTLTAAGMEDCNPNSVPAAHAALGADKEGPNMDEPWNYRGICGMLLYLATNTRPDIQFAVSQVCRFGHNPKQSHATAVKTILRYLKKTSDKGMIIKPKDNSFDLDLYVDADFCGLFGREDPRDPNSVRSRTGYVIILCGWPIVWKSQLQTHLSQSTLEAEYSALSSSLKVFIPLKRLIMEMIEETRCRQLEAARLLATVFEDNAGTYFLATNQRITSRTKYLLAKWHWFWDAYNRSEFSIVKCPTDEQLSDYLTKAQPRATFEKNRVAVQGW